MAEDAIPAFWQRHLVTFETNMKGMKKPIHTTKDCIAPPMALPLTLMPSKDRKGPVPAGRRKMPKAKLAPTVPAAAPVIAESRKHPSRRRLLFSFSASAASRLASQLAADSLSSLAPARTSASPPRSARERVAMARTSLRARRPPAWIDPGTPTLRRPDSPVTSITQVTGRSRVYLSLMSHAHLSLHNKRPSFFSRRGRAAGVLSARSSLSANV